MLLPTEERPIPRIALTQAELDVLLGFADQLESVASVYDSVAALGCVTLLQMLRRHIQLEVIREAAEEMESSESEEGVMGDPDLADVDPDDNNNQ